MIDYKRQVLLFDPSKHTERVAVVGLGNIGSHTALAIARMGMSKIDLYDFDTVEVHNLSSQAYTYEDIGKYKGDALKAHILAVNPSCIVTVHKKAFQDVKERDADVYIIAVDSMGTRFEIDAILKDGGRFIIDGRCGGGQLEVYAQTADKWGVTLVTDADTDECGARYISYVSYLIAGCIANTLKRYLNKQRYPKRFIMHADTYDILKLYDK